MSAFYEKADREKHEKILIQESVQFLKLMIYNNGILEKSISRSDILKSVWISSRCHDSCY